MPPVTRHAARACTPVKSTPPASPNTRSKLKRSASTASLPSPPPTIRRSKSRASKASVYSSSEDEAGELPIVVPRAATPSHASLPRLNLSKIIEEGEGTEEEHEGKRPHEEAKEDTRRPPMKKRRLSDLVTELNSEVKEASEAEDAFWLDLNHPRAGTSKPSPSKKPKSSSSVESDAEKKHPSRVAQASEGAYSLASPPPSRVHRSTTKTKAAISRSKTTAIKGLKSILNPRAKTQPRLKHTSDVKNKVPVRDPVNNPFLSDAVEAPPKRQIPYNQMPTLTYVFRGKRQEFQNPEYKAPPDPRTRLPIDHEDYVASEDIKPRRLFGAYSKLDLEAWDSDDEEGPAVPLAPPPKKRARTPEDAESEHDTSSDKGSSPVASSSTKVDVREELEEEERERRAAIKPVVPSRRPAAHHDRQTRPMPVRISSAVREMSSHLFKERR